MKRHLLLRSVQMDRCTWEASIREVEQNQRDNAAVSDQITLLEEAWSEDYQQGLRSVLRELVQEANLRHAGVVVSVYAMPQKAVCGFKPDAAPAVMILCPLWVRQRKRSTA